jgi:hypothetical protein
MRPYYPDTKDSRKRKSEPTCLTNVDTRILNKYWKLNSTAREKDYDHQHL